VFGSFKRRKTFCKLCGLAYCGLEACFDHKQKTCRACLRTDEDPDIDFTVSNSNVLIKVCEAKDLPVKDSSMGGCNAYAVIVFEGKKYQTLTVDHTTTPRFNQQFSIPVNGHDNALQVALFHEDKFHHPEFLGLVHIPLGSFAVDELADKWYNLEKRPGLIDQKKVISGSVRLQVIYTTSLNALYAPMAVDGVKKPPLSTAHLRANIRRAQILWRSLQIDWWRSSYEEIMAWRKPMRTLLCFVSYSLLILSYPSSWLAPLIPLTMLMIMSANYVDARYNAADAKYG